VKNTMWQEYKNYIAVTESAISVNPKQFWNYMRPKKKGTDIPTQMSYRGDTITGPREIVKMFSDFFQSVFNPTSKSPDCSKRGGNYNSNITLSPVDDLKVLRVLKKLKSDGIRGPDQIPAFFITQYAEF